MWGESSKKCELNCQCSGLITEKFKINSGNNATKRKQDEALNANFKYKITPHSLNFTKSPSPNPTPSKRRVLGEIQNSSCRILDLQSPVYKPKVSPVIERLRSPLVDRSASPGIERLRSPLVDRSSPVIDRLRSPLLDRSSPVSKPVQSTRISRIFEERTRFKMSNKENILSETFGKLDVEEETRDCLFGVDFQTRINNWSATKLDFTDAIPTMTFDTENLKTDLFVPEKETERTKMEPDLDSDFQSLHDLEEEFDADNFDHCTKYEIISTDSPNIISRGRSSTSRKVNSRNFVFGAPLSDSEQSTSFNRPNANATRMLNFEDESFEFTSPAAKRPSTSLSVKKSLKFNETPTKHPLRHERSDSSIGSMSSSPTSTKLRLFTSESTTSMESGFISEFEEPFLDIEEATNSPKLANFNELLSGQIKDGFNTEKDFLKRPIHRSLSFNPESKARVSLLSILESPKKSAKRVDCGENENVVNKRRRQNPLVEKVRRPVLQRAFSENNASIMSALARSDTDPDLIGDFSLPFALPLTSGNHSDLKSISCETLAGLLRGNYDHCISDYQVIDCRYPYEYSGGHILGAVNLYTQAQILALVNKPLQPRDIDAKRSILVFHCEFSLERGPNLSRYLRSSDRQKNKENYPSLHYPEIYLLHEGYRAFYEKHKDLCSPSGYTAMLDPKHKDLLRQHRSVTPSTTSSVRRNRLLL